MSPLLTEELPDVTEGCQGTLSSGGKTQSELTVRHLTLPQMGEGTAHGSPPFSSVSLWLSSAVSLAVGCSECYFPLSSYQGPRCHSAMSMTPKCHAWSMITKVSAFCELIYVWFIYFILCI